ncbi:MAG: transcription-repair coupling factor [Thiotrichaceae bacterium]|nr:transcription-repair coupling factor [Thiotrichaceae bacterium]PCI13163.1 MAG: transcription-repair coupling factor [Thiotrichales bacterium]
MSAISPFSPPLPSAQQPAIQWGKLYGNSSGLAISRAAQQHDGPLLVITADIHGEETLAQTLGFYLGNAPEMPVSIFPDRETLPYDHFSPHQDIISDRLGALYQLPTMSRGIIIVPVSTLMHRLPPREYLEANTLMLDVGQKLNIEEMRTRLDKSGYRYVSQVMEHGEFTVRGGLFDLFPMGCKTPFRIDLFDDEIETMRTFDPESQRSLENIDKIRLMPAREFPLSDDGINRFRQQYRLHFEGNPQNGLIYRDVSQGLAPAGIEYYLPLFFEQTQTLFDYLPDNTLIISAAGASDAARQFWDESHERYESARHDLERPLLSPKALFIEPQALLQQLQRRSSIQLNRTELEDANSYNFATRSPPKLSLPPRAPHPLGPLLTFIDSFEGRVLIAAETTGRRETLLEMFRDHEHYPKQLEHWAEFIEGDAPLAITVAPFDDGMVFDGSTDGTGKIAVISEAQLFGEQVMQRRRRKKRGRDVEAVVKNLTELTIGSPVVHEEHGVGRYLGLQTLDAGGQMNEYLLLEYAGGDKLYVPVSSLHLISRYAGVSEERSPLHRLGTEQWSKAKRKAAERAHDVAAELLDIYARRAARKGHAFPPIDEQYAAFAAAFPFEETPDQQEAIIQLISDMTTDKPMDRLICGDVGFGKTEVAMRAAFVAIQGGAQVAVLVPTTLLAQQHYQTFKDRFADWPVQVEVLSRFKTKKQTDEALKKIEDGRVDIVVGTHKLISGNIKFDNLGLFIIDEEHRFGVKQKEQLKSLRTDVDTLSLTATPIPRSLNMALTGIHDLSIIATPPLRRIAIKTFVRQWNDTLIREACLREIRRGGQLYFLHNEVRTIEKITEDLKKLVPEAEIKFAHGQMNERDLEQIMLDFYHQRFNILVSTTIIESGIDVPNANTIIMNRADKLGIAQLYQLRGRVGRSHHQAYAYLITPPKNSMTKDAEKRLEAIESIEELGAGFTLATHDLEIRGAGEFLGDEQSGHIHEIGFSMYTDLLERAVEALKAGKQPELLLPLNSGSEIDLGVPARLPEDYLPDVHSRLVLYKRISNAKDKAELRELQVEMIDRFGLLPEPAKNLMVVTALKLVAAPIGIRKIEADAYGGRIVFGDQPNVDPLKIINLIQRKPNTYKPDGQEKLRFTLSMPELQDRIDAITELLGLIAADG